MQLDAGEDETPFYKPPPETATAAQGEAPGIESGAAPAPEPAQETTQAEAAAQATVEQEA